MMTAFRPLVLVLSVGVSVSLSSVAFAQDAGVLDGGSEGCAIECVGDDLFFCDGATDELVRVDCTDFGGRCGLLYDDWGADCVLSEDAECSPGYADDRSRCDPGVPLYCNEGICSTEVPAPVSNLIAPSSAGGIGSVGTGDESPFACVNCNEGLPFDIPFISLFVGLGMRRVRRGLRHRRHGNK